MGNDGIKWDDMGYYYRILWDYIGLNNGVIMVDNCN